VITAKTAPGITRIAKSSAKIPNPTMRAGVYSVNRWLQAWQQKSRVLRPVAIPNL
jgi:hypothetical protein